MRPIVHHLGSLTIYEGDVRASLALMPEKSAHVSVSSPPYWQLRSYLPAGHELKPLELGSEPTPDEFVENLVGVYRGVRRVLRDDGTIFVNLGDTYAGGGRGGNPEESPFQKQATNAGSIHGPTPEIGLSSGSQVLIPHRFALAMQRDGWILRDTIIWAKRSPMPQSVRGWAWERCRVKVGNSKRANGGTYHAEAQDEKPHGARDGRDFATQDDRFAPCPGCEKCRANGGLVLRRGSWRHTASFEYIFMFAKTGDYFCDGEAAQEKAEPSTLADTRTNADGHRRDRNQIGSPSNGGTNLGSGETRNPRNVWTLSNEPSSLAHFAGFPREIPLRCLKSAPCKVCSACGDPYAPVVTRARVATRPGTAPKEGGEEANRDPYRHVATSSASEYRPTCTCNAAEGRATVLDPFFGTGTTGEVAVATGRKAIGCELNPAYVEMIRERLGATVPLFTTKHSA